MNLLGCEDLWIDVEIKQLRKSYSVGIIYRHPHNNNLHLFFVNFNQMLFCMNSKGRTCIILGNININLNENTLNLFSKDYLKIL